MLVGQPLHKSSWLPDRVYIIFIYLFINGYDWYFFRRALGYQEAVKGIIVVFWQMEYLQNMANLYRQGSQVVFMDAI
jgi:hypothetical protein